jgi:bifunctional non-homologous end joining protein LigD
MNPGKPPKHTPATRRHRRLTTARSGDVVAQLSELEEQGGGGTLDLGGGASLAVSHLGKVFFPEAKLTKGDLMRYYARVAPVLLPLLADRPLVLKRYPDGVGGESFFQQKAPAKTPEGVRVEPVPAEGNPARRLVGGDLITLLYSVQLGTITANPWHSRVGALQYTDYAVLDLDPGPKAKFRFIVEVARWLQELLDRVKLNAAVKTSGKRGMHIYIPLPPKTSPKAARLVAQILARQVEAAHPKETTTTRSLKGRGAAMVYVDYMQNDVGKSVASAFSVRERPDATVSTPLEWSELTAHPDPHDFTVSSVMKDVDRRARIWTKAMGAGARNDLRRLAKD